MTRIYAEYAEYPRELAVNTKYGTVYVACTGSDNDHIHVDCSSNGKGLTYRGNRYPFSVHLGRYNGVWQEYHEYKNGVDTGAPSRTSVSCEAPRTYKAALLKEVVANVGAFLTAHQHLLDEGRAAYFNNLLYSEERDIAELKEKLAAATKRQRALEGQLAALHSAKAGR